MPIYGRKHCRLTSHESNAVCHADDLLPRKHFVGNHWVLCESPFVDDECNDAAKSNKQSTQDVSANPWMGVTASLQSNEARR